MSKLSQKIIKKHKNIINELVSNIEHEIEDVIYNSSDNLDQELNEELNSLSNKEITIVQNYAINKALKNQFRKN